MKPAKPEILLRPKLLAVSVAACFALNAQANPTGPTVVHGSVGFNGLGTSALTITNQAGGNAIINWNGFSIGVNELTRFQQFQNLAVLNRVTGNDVSSILGALQSDGRVFLINPNGIVFGASARIDTAGLIASSLALSDQDFLGGRLRFTEVPGAGAVVNNGVIETATGGRVYLVAPSVENSGLVHSPGGAIVLAAGKEVELVDAASPFVTVKVAAAEQAVNVGTLVSDGGQIGMFGALVRNAGVIEAGGAVAGPGGEIRLVAAKDLNVEAGSVVSASGTSGGKVLLQAEGGTTLVGGTVEAKGSSGKGGSVSALGVRVGVVGHGVIDASGDTGGGTVLVGGDYQGRNAEVQNAERTYIGADGVIRADAMRTGDGGRVVVWADGDTRFFGSISARGGSEGGNGGFVETSGKGALEAFGRVTTAAPNGQGGTWLLDPTFINIVAGSAGPFYGGLISFFDGGTPPVTSTIGVNSIDDGMSSNGSVRMEAVQDISLQANIALTNRGDLTLVAGDNIHLGVYGISLLGNLTLTANDSFAQSAYGAVPTTAAITSAPGGGNITTNGGSLFASGKSVTLGNINTSDTTSPSDAVNGLGNGLVSISATGGNIVTGSITTRGLHPVFGLGGDVIVSTDDGTIVVNGNIDTRGANGSTVAADTCGGECIAFFYGGTWAGDVTLARSAVDAFAGTAVRVNGSILTAGGDGASTTGSFLGNQSGGAGGDVFVSTCLGSCGPLSGSVVVTGAINTNGGSGGATGEPSSSTQGDWAGDVRISATGSIGIGSIVARGGSGGSGSDGAYGGGNYGDWGGWIQLNGGGAVSVNSIDVSGGAGGAAGGSVSGDSWGGNGGWAGGVSIQSSSTTIGSIIARGGSGARGGTAGGYTYAYGGDGGEGGYVSISALSGAISLGPVDLAGGNGGAGGNGDYATGGYAGGGGSLYLNSSGAIVVGNISATGGNGGNGGNGVWDASGGSGRYGGYVSMNGASIATGSILATGGAGGSGGTISDGNGSANGGAGGWGGFVDLRAMPSARLVDGPALVVTEALVTKEVAVSPSFTLVGGPLATGAINVSGGSGGNSGAIGSSFTSGGPGGSGGSATLVGSTINVAGPILAKGGNGGSVINASLSSAGTPVGGAGGSGGVVWVYGLGKVQVNVGGALGALAIDVAGGAGGNGNPATSPAGNGGVGGNGGSANVVGTPDMTLFGSIIASGGSGGAGGAGSTSFRGGNGGNGGLGGSIYLDASTVTESNVGDGFIFVLAGSQRNVLGGFGGAGGADGGAGAGTDGNLGTPNTFVKGVDYFGTILVLDPLSQQEVNQSYQGIVEGKEKTQAYVGGEKETDEEEDKSQKELGSCKG